MSSALLCTLASSLIQNMQGSFWGHESLRKLHLQTRSLGQSLAGYADYLSSQNKIMKGVHVGSCPVRQLSESLSVKYIGSCHGETISRLVTLLECLQEREDGEYLELNEFTPDQPRQRYKFIQCLERNGLPVPIMLLTYCSGNNAGHLHFVWKLPPGKAPEDTFQDSVRVVEKIKSLLPQYHTRAMCRAMFDKFGRVSLNVKSAVL